MKLTELIAAFQRGEFRGPGGPLQAQACIETRRAVILMTADAVIKIRRPLRVGDLDQTSQAVRAAQAEQERWFGRRISPQVYLQDASLVQDPDGHVRLVAGSDGAEAVVAMRRLDDAVRADLLATADDRPPDLLYPLMERLAEYHAEAPIHWGPDSWTDPERLARRFEALFEALAPGEGAAIIGEEALHHLRAETRGWLDELSPTLAHRVREGRIREIHGDLRLEHVYLTDPIAIIDPAEGPVDNHLLDIGEEVCQLGMELDAIGWADVAEQTLAYYAQLTSDKTLQHVAPLYKRLRAIHHALDQREVAALSPAEQQEAALIRARFFIDLALSYGAWAL